MIENRNGGGDGGHIVAAEAGYYTITINTADNTAKMVVHIQHQRLLR